MMGFGITADHGPALKEALRKTNAKKRSLEAATIEEDQGEGEELLPEASRGLSVEEVSHLPRSR